MTEKKRWIIGEAILDQYDVTDLQSEGGIGTVYKVHHCAWKVDLVVKSTRPEFFVRGQERELHPRCSDLDHPGIASPHRGQVSHKLLGSAK